MDRWFGHRYTVRYSLLILPLMALLAGCAVTGTPPHIAPANVVDNATAAQIDEFVTGEMRDRHIAGLSVAVISGGEIRYAKGHGWADIDKRMTADAGTPYLIASITKMFTAVGTMQLFADGKVQLDASVEQYVADLPALWRPVTVRQLLNHTSGINNFTGHDAPPCGPVTKEEAEYAPLDVIAEVSCLPLDFKPGTSWSYSDTGYHVLGLLIERVSGLAYPDYLRQRIFEPAGMRSTFLIGPIGGDDGRAVGYSWNGEQFVPAPSLNPVVEGPSGGLASSVQDLARFDAVLGDGRVLALPLLHTMWQPAGIGTAMYGLGFGVRPINGRRQVGHTGGGPGAATSFARFGDDDLTVIVLTNTAQRPQSIQEIVGGIADLLIASRLQR